MALENILLIVIVILLFQTNRRLDKFSGFFEEKNNPEENNNAEERSEETAKTKTSMTIFQNRLFEDLEVIKKRIIEMSAFLTIENPAWGKSSAISKKKNRLIELYTQHLVETEKLSQKDALIKASFVAHNFKDDVAEDITRELNRYAGTSSEDELRASKFFKKEVDEKTLALSAADIFEPLWVGIVRKKYKKDERLFQSTKKAFESYNGECCYETYVEDAAIIQRLLQLGILRVPKDDEDSCNIPSYLLNETDLKKLREIIFVGDRDKNEYFNDDYFEERHPTDESFDMPFCRLFE